MLFLYTILCLNNNINFIHSNIVSLLIRDRRKKMPINQTETNLQAITVTIDYLEKQESVDEEILKKLKDERTSLLKKLNVLE